jgi:hypothetical protein
MFACWEAAFPAAADFALAAFDAAAEVSAALVEEAAVAFADCSAERAVCLADLATNAQAGQPLIKHECNPLILGERAQLFVVGQRTGYRRCEFS